MALLGTFDAPDLPSYFCNSVFGVGLTRQNPLASPRALEFCSDDHASGRADRVHVVKAMKETRNLRMSNSRYRDQHEIYFYNDPSVPSSRSTTHFGKLRFSSSRRETSELHFDNVPSNLSALCLGNVPANLATTIPNFSENDPLTGSGRKAIKKGNVKPNVNNPILELVNVTPDLTDAHGDKENFQSQESSLILVDIPSYLGASALDNPLPASRGPHAQLAACSELVGNSEVPSDVTSTRRSWTMSPRIWMTRAQTSQTTGIRA